MATNTNATAPNIKDKKILIAATSTLPTRLPPFGKTHMNKWSVILARINPARLGQPKKGRINRFAADHLPQDVMR